MSSNIFISVCLFFSIIYSVYNTPTRCINNQIPNPTIFKYHSLNFKSYENMIQYFTQQHQLQQLKIKQIINYSLDPIFLNVTNYTLNEFKSCQLSNLRFKKMLASVFEFPFSYYQSLDNIQWYAYLTVNGTRLKLYHDNTQTSITICQEILKGYNFGQIICENTHNIYQVHFDLECVLGRYYMLLEPLQSITVNNITLFFSENEIQELLSKTNIIKIENNKYFFQPNLNKLILSTKNKFKTLFPKFNRRYDIIEYQLNSFTTYKFTRGFIINETNLQIPLTNVYGNSLDNYACIL